MKKNSNIAKFAIWIVRFCTANNITTASFTDEQETIIRAKCNELNRESKLSGSNLQQFYFDCGVLTSAALLDMDALELMVNEMRY
jgi:hypothetical protein